MPSVALHHNVSVCNSAERGGTTQKTHLLARGLPLAPLRRQQLRLVGVNWAGHLLLAAP